ncbi:MAG: hypothetical protein IKJ68_12245 [Clostridia bacterium]|nr:hypothetical protein [Clostridia bacterium]
MEYEIIEKLNSALSDLFGSVNEKLPQLYCICFNYENEQLPYVSNESTFFIYTDKAKAEETARKWSGNYYGEDVIRAANIGDIQKFFAFMSLCDTTVDFIVDGKGKITRFSQVCKADDARLMVSEEDAKDFWDKVTTCRLQLKHVSYLPYKSETSKNLQWIEAENNIGLNADYKELPIHNKNISAQPPEKTKSKPSFDGVVGMILGILDFVILLCADEDFAIYALLCAGFGLGFSLVSLKKFRNNKISEKICAIIGFVINGIFWALFIWALVGIGQEV